MIAGGALGRARHHRVVVVGAGASGIATARELRRAGITDVVLLEKAAEVGGTWRDNTYPGCSCDVPSVWYSFSFAPNPFWSRFYSRQAEILDYLRATAWREGIMGHIRFGVEVTSARWEPSGPGWRIETTEGPYRADVLVAAAGPLHQPNLPEIDGIERFGGAMFHSARWDHGHDLTGERVAVIGTGASAIQFVPRIQPAVASLHVFQRTAPWVLPKLDFPIPWVGKQAMHWVPLAERTARHGVYLAHEAAGVAFRDARLMRALQPAARRHLHRQVGDRGLRRVLNPAYTLGCKRVLLSNDWYPALTRDNVTVHPSAVRGMEAGAVIDGQGERTEVDTVIWATGFEVARPPISHRVGDADGRSLAEAWASGPRAYLGTTVPGFPNLFLLLGPNIVPGHASVLTTIEAQARYIAAAVAAMVGAGWGALEVDAAVAASLDERVQAALAGTVYNDGCSSYYLDGGRNIANWPWSLTRLHRRFRFDPADYRVSGAA